jgi:4-hydroxy-tetrahydrodipicolinate synthase
MKPITGSIVALVTPMHEDAAHRFRRVASPRRLAHRRRPTQCIGAVSDRRSPTVSVEDIAR